jgi:exopolysaccharide biosynthesis polyprenyl glycosylphosphotransferase
MAVEALRARWSVAAPDAQQVQRCAKRTLDLVLASLLLMLLLVLFIAIGLAIRVSSAGPIVFRQQRVGKDGRPFEIYKFRTMAADVDARAHAAYYRLLVQGRAAPVGGVFKLAGDPRVTRIGRLLRCTSLDELPQLINVLKGDMSLVGPRPPIAYEVEEYGQRELRRLSVVPGITGLWQVSGRSRLTFEQMIDLDLEYIDRWSFWLDIRILLRTPWVVLTRHGAC